MTIRKETIFEVPVYCGRLKEWRILNLSTGTIYSTNFPTEKDALRAINNETVRNGHPVKAITVAQLSLLANAETQKTWFSISYDNGEEMICHSLDEVKENVLEHHAAGVPVHSITEENMEGDTLRNFGCEWTVNIVSIDPNHP